MINWTKTSLKEHSSGSICDAYDLFGKREDIDVKVLMLNGSAKTGGNTASALKEAGKILEESGIEYEIFQLGGGPIRDCIGCNQCNENGCVFGDDKVNEFVAKARDCDGFVFGSPVYYAHPSGRILSFLDRVFYSSSDAFSGKPGFVLAVARRGGTTASVDALGKYFSIAGMLNVGTTYWPILHGHTPGEAAQDEEGMQTIRNAARYLAWILKCIQSADENGIDRPQIEHTYMTNFIR